MTQDQLSSLLNAYQGAKSASGLKDRTEFLAKPLTEEEKRLVNFYMFETDKMIGDLAKAEKLSPHIVYSRIMRACLKLVYQHREKLLKGKED